MASRAPRSEGAPRADPARVEAALGRAVSAQLAPLLPRQRWFGDKGRTIAGVRLRDCGALGDRAWLVLVDVTFEAVADETYAVPLVLGGDGAAPGALVMTLDLDGEAIRADDAFDDHGFCLELLTAFERGVTVPMLRHGAVRFIRTERFPTLGGAASLAPRRLTAEQSNTSVAYGDRLVVKALRRVKPGITLDYEVGAFLTFRARFSHVPPLAGAIEHVPVAGEVTTLGLLQGYVAQQRDRRSWVAGHPRQLSPPGVAEQSEHFFPELSGRGVVRGALHVALASDAAAPGFAPEPPPAADVTAWIERLGEDVGRTCDAVRARLAAIPRELADDARMLLGSETALRSRARDLVALGAERCMKVRVHGDYHLGQTLRTEAGFVVLDFEGEPARPIAERRRKQCALVDVAGMLRSLDYAVHATLTPASAPTRDGERWIRRASAAFLEGYLEGVATAPTRLFPTSPAGFARALAVFELDNALYQVRYELDNRPAWLAIPLRGLTRLLARERAVS